MVPLQIAFETLEDLRGMTRSTLMKVLNQLPGSISLKRVTFSVDDVYGVTLAVGPEQNGLFQLARKCGDPRFVATATVPTVSDADSSVNKTVYIVVERVLSTRTSLAAKLELGQVMHDFAPAFWSQIVPAIRRMHRLGYANLNIRPENIACVRDDHLQLHVRELGRSVGTITHKTRFGDLHAAAVCLAETMLGRRFEASPQEARDQWQQHKHEFDQYCADSSEWRQAMLFVEQFMGFTQQEPLAPKYTALQKKCILMRNYCAGSSKPECWKYPANVCKALLEKHVDDLHEQISDTEVWKARRGTQRCLPRPSLRAEAREVSREVLMIHARQIRQTIASVGSSDTLIDHIVREQVDALREIETRSDTQQPSTADWAAVQTAYYVAQGLNSVEEDVPSLKIFGSTPRE